MTIVLAAEAASAVLTRILVSGGRVLGGVGGRIITAETGKKITQIILKSGNGEIVLDKETSKDKDKQEKCNKCEAYVQGFKTVYLRTMGDRFNADYQFMVSNFSSIPITFSQYAPFIKDGNKKETTPLEEWKLKNVSFDGLWPIPCILVEAKGKYDQFLAKNNVGKKDGKERVFMEDISFGKLLKEAQTQNLVRRSLKKVGLHWHFAEKEAKEHFDGTGGNRFVTSIFFPMEFGDLNG